MIIQMPGMNYIKLDEKIQYVISLGGSYEAFLIGRATPKISSYFMFYSRMLKMIF